MNVMCSRCKKRVAVIFLTRLENGQSVNEGLCLQCAKEMGAIDRVMWGSDAPTVLVACTYKQHVDCVARYTSFLTDDELENLMGKTADKFWFSK